MSQRYRLVFRGEVLDGQHKAVVKKRLGAALKVEGERLDAMFTGKAVTIRKEADTDTAAKFQVAFKRAGARLRVLPIASESAGEPAPPEPAPVADPNAFKLAPRGASMADPQPPARRADVDLSHLTLAARGAALGQPRTVDATAPDVSHLSVASPGAILGEVAPLPVIEPDVPSWDVAEAGADLGTLAPPIEPPFDLDAIEFELAPAGTLLVDADDTTPPQPPDTSHLRLQ